MTPLEFTLVTFFIAIGAGVLGSVLGLGGGIIVIPALTLLLHIDIRYAIGASIVSVIATSSAAASAYVRERMCNMRVAMFLEVATTAGAITGAFIAGRVNSAWLFIVFGVIMAYAALSMLRQRQDVSTQVPSDALADRLQLHDAYYDPALNCEVSYRVTHSWLGLGVSYIAGCVSGLLGIGGGALKVPLMDLLMRLPIKVSTATSNFMIGVTAAASAGVYFARGDINPFIAGPVAAGVLLGATGGSALLGHLQSRLVRITFVIVLIIISAQMLWKGAHGL